MLDKIIVGVDGAEGGVDAMALARRLASPGTEVVAVAVAVLDALPWRGVSLEYDREVRAEAGRRLDDLAAADPDQTGEALSAPSVASGLHEAADRLGADLIVIGSCRRGPFGRMFAGDDVRDTLRGSPCPVAVAPRDHVLRDAPITTIGVGWDDGDEAALALSFARGLADDQDARVHVLAVVEPPAWPGLDGASSDPASTARTETLTAHVEALEDVEAETRTGVPVDELARFAGDVDLLVVGSRQHGPIGRIVVGSTSEQLVRRCVRPLVVVPRSMHPAPVPAVVDQAPSSRPLSSA